MNDLIKPVGSLLLAAGIMVSPSCSTSKKEGAPQKKPNIVFIFADDLGWTSLSSYGNPYVNTKNLDKLASEGMRFTDAYVTPQCTPSRASLLTGQYVIRNRMWHVVPYYSYPWARMTEPEYLEDLPRESYTMAEALQDNGYKTAILGKWHLSLYQHDGYYTRLWDSCKQYYGFDYVNPVTNPTEYQSYGDKGVNFLTNEAISFMDKNKDKPFFIYLAHHTIHGPVLAPDSLVQKYLGKGFPKEGQFNATYLAALEHLDNSVGRLMDEIDRLGIADNTLVIFYSDNGGVDAEFDNKPLRAGKGSAYEGGIRVPLIARWKGKIKAGTVSHYPVTVVDMYPTLLDLAGGTKPECQTLDGISLKSLLLEGKDPDRQTLYWYMPLYDPQWGATPAAVIRDGDYKLIESFGDYINVEKDLKYIPEGRVELYNLSADIGETNDLSKSMPEKTQQLREKLHKWIRDNNGAFPVVNPDFDIKRVYDRNR